MSLPKNIEIFIDKKDINKYYFYLARIVSDKKIITKKEKKFLDAKILFDNKSYDAKIRIAGDWSDHVTTVNSSLKIKLLNGNIGNITNFKIVLLTTQDPDLPHKATGRSEILWSLLMEHLGFPTTHREIINVNLNGYKYKAIFQETPAKEFLERWGMKESPIIEFDEREMWDNRIKQAETNNPSHIATKIINGSFLKNNANIKIANEALFNPIVQNNLNEYPDINLFNRELYLNLNKKYASHGLFTHNLNFAYDHYYKMYFPLYKEGLVKIPSCSRKITKAFLSENFNFIKLFEKRVGATINKNELCFLQKVLAESKEIKNIKKLDLIKPETNLNNIKMISGYNEIFTYFNFDENLNSTKICDHKYNSINKCKPINFEKAKNYFKAEINLNKKATRKPYPIFFKNHVTKVKEFKKINKKKFKIDLTSNENFFYEVSKNTEIINIKLSDQNLGNIILKGNFNEDIQINVIDNRSKNFLENNESFYKLWQDNYLTGCLTFLDSNFSGGTFTIKNAKCEDAINIVRSAGYINKINIQNSSSDGLDIDFSKIKINEMDIENSGNDCSDFSYGEYKVENANLKNCGDKAISVGEKSNFEINFLNAKNVSFGAVSKDSSKLFIKKGKVQNNSDFCLAAYNKKQEFNGGDIVYNDIFCDNEDFFNDNFSDISKK
ncbi:hypothetical protein [Candidatus Pelagibacter sp.]|uniref:hypothetical protein n=1 Tax=Candidatus Pelagibacter sp. TaxID=2024849 RepID=UPI003F859755